MMKDGMEREKNFNIMNLYMREKFYMGKNGMEKEKNLIKMVN